MTETTETKLSPEAIKMLNEMAAGRSSGVNLTPKAQANLDRAVNEYLTNDYTYAKYSYLVASIIVVLVGLFGLAYMADGMFEGPEQFVDAMYKMVIAVPVSCVVFFGAYRAWSIYKRM